MEDILKANRPSLSPSSVYNYVSSLKKLYRDATGMMDYDMKTFNNVALMEMTLMKRPISSQQTLFSYLYVYTQNPTYQEAMQRAKTIHNEQVNQQLPTDPDKTTTMKEVKELFKQLKTESDAIYAKGDFTPENVLKIQDMLLIALLGNIYIPPRRAMDYTELLIHGYDEEANMVRGRELIFHKYKTVKTYGVQVIKIPKPLQKLLDQYATTFKDATYLFTTLKGKKLSGKQLWDRLHAIFGKSVSVNALRRAFITDTYAKYDQQTKQLEKDMKAMGSSIIEANYYIQSKPSNITKMEVIVSPENIENEIVTPKKVRKPYTKKTKIIVEE
jgi:hypothetical protein